MRSQVLHPRTSIINNKQKNQSKNARLSALNWLAEQFPLAFDSSVKISPLKIGIMSDILQYTDKITSCGISKSKLREAVVIYTRRIDYLTCLKAREMRIDLQGNPVAQVTEEEAEKASAKIKKRIEKSAKNAKKNPLGKPILNKKSLPQTNQFILNEPLNYYTGGIQQQTIKNSSAVVVKHKTSRQYDPQAVARLKEKLGLTREQEDN